MKSSIKIALATSALALALLTTEQQALFDDLKPAGHPGPGAGGPPPDQN